MIKPFQFARTPAIIFGQGKISLLPGIILKKGRKIVLVTGKSSFRSSGLFQKLNGALVAGGIDIRTIIAEGEPSPVMIDNSVAALKGFDADVVVAVGGGSVLDAGKAISAMMCAGGAVSDYLEEIGTREHTGEKIPFIAVPTTSGTGSEATKNAVISSTGINGFKKSLRHDNFTPDIALVDPELTLSCPPEITASTGMDCFTQLLEAFLSTRGNEYTDALALEGIKAVRSSLLRSYLDGTDPEARAGMSFAALTSGICLANAGLGTVHGFASSIGGIYNIPHGLICGTLMAVTNEITVRKLRMYGNNPGALRKYAILGKLFLDENKPDDYLIDSFIGQLHELTDALGLKGLRTAGVDDSAAAGICATTGNKNNPAELDYNDLMEILKRRLV